MEYNYWLPKKNGKKEELKTENNSVVIIGANGAGKSKLGAWIEQQDFEKVHRIAAQRSLVFDENIRLKSYEEAKNMIFYGSNDKKLFDEKNKKWNWGKGYTTTELNDYNDVLAALIAMKNNQQDEFIEKFKETSEDEKNKLKNPETVIDKLKIIWNKIFPHRSIKFEDGRILASYNWEGDNSIYNAREMSDGERVVLYLIAQCLCIPENKIIIIDEPELHLHRSIMNQFWLEIENKRKDSLFIYITHDTQFAAAHSYSDKIWIKEYDGENWEWEKVEKSELPEQCLLDILGNRKHVLFVEGTQNSYDTNIYREIYKDMFVVPCESCLKVIEYTKAMNSNEQLHHLNVRGLIDRDYRTEEEIENLKKNNIYVLDIAEVENLFCVEEVLNFVNSHQRFEDCSRVEEVKKYIIKERFSKQIEGQINKAVISEVKYLLNTYDLSGKSLEDVEDKLEKIPNQIPFKTIRDNVTRKFKNALDEKDYSSILRVFNEKKLSENIGQYFGLNNKDYCKLVIRLLKSGQSEELIEGIKKYLPEL